jgi:hypothetical protein
VTASPDGRMFGFGHVDSGGQHHHFAFRVSQLRNRDYGRLEYWTNDPRRCSIADHDYGREGGGDRDWSYGHDHGSRWNRFEATVITDVFFLDDPAFRDSRHSQRPRVDTVRFSGSGRWNGQPGYRFEATATDQGEPGRQRDTFSLVVRDPLGRIVANVSSALDGGNVDSTRF